MSKLPRMYVDSKLFPRGKLKDGIKKTELPDPQLEDVHPDEEDGIESVVVGDEDKISKRVLTPKAAAAGKTKGGKIKKPPKGAKISTKTLKAIDLLNSMLKAGAHPPSSGRETKDEDRAIREQKHSYYKEWRGVGDAHTPDLPEQGRDWHGTVDEEDEPDEEYKVGDMADKSLSGFEILDASTEEIAKAFAGAPRFNNGPLVPPREKEFLLQEGYSPEEVDRGEYVITPRLRYHFNRWLTGTVQKSINQLKG